MEKFEINILGCGSALPTARHLPTSQVLNIREKIFMIDCGEGAQLGLRNASLRMSRLSHIFISHLHGDHCFGLIGLISTLDLLGRTALLHIYSPGTSLEALLRPQLDFFCRGMGYEVVFHSFSPNHSEVIYDDRSVTVTTLPLQHRVPCCGFLFKEKPLLPHIRRDMIDFLRIPIFAINGIKEGAGWTDESGRHWRHEELTTPSDPGRSYAFCSDTMPARKLIPLIEGVDLLYHEATFSNADASRARETGHSTALQAAGIAREASAKQLLIGHFSARYKDDKVLLNEAKVEFENTILAREGMKITL